MVKELALESDVTFTSVPLPITIYSYSVLASHGVIALIKQHGIAPSVFNSGALSVPCSWLGAESRCSILIIIFVLPDRVSSKINEELCCRCNLRQLIKQRNTCYVGYWKFRIY